MHASVFSLRGCGTLGLNEELDFKSTAAVFPREQERDILKPSQEQTILQQCGSFLICS